MTLHYSMQNWDTTPNSMSVTLYMYVIYLVHTFCACISVDDSVQLQRVLIDTYSVRF